MARHAEVVARWVVRRRRARKQGCEGCGTRFDGVVCPACGRAGRLVAVQAMALVVELQGGTFDGIRHVEGWVPQRLVTATGPNPLPR